MNLSDKTALITGGGTGIGAAVALALAEAGCRVAIAGRREEKLREVAAAFPLSGSESPRQPGCSRTCEPAILSHICDVANLEDVTRLVEWAGRELERIDILVNSAGINVRQRAMAELSPHDWEKVLAVNTTGTFYTMRAVLPQMRDRRDGVIINICSVAGLRAGLLGGVAYNASKFAMAALGKTVGEEERNNGIRVTTIYPGEVETPILDDRPVPVTAEHRARILQPEDVAACVLAVATLPPRARIPELVVIPTVQSYV